MLTTALRCSAAVVIVSAWLGGCTSKLPLDDELYGGARDTLDVGDPGHAQPARPSPSSPDAGSTHVVSTQLGATDAGSSHVTPADPGSYYPAAPDADPEIYACTDHLASLISADCEACEQTHCAAETASCYGSCRGLISCAADACIDRPSDVGCVFDACRPCIGDADPAIAWANCVESHCPDSCAFVTRLPNPERVPPPPPSDECRDDLAGTLGDACTACFEQECTQAYSECGDSCRSLITCAVGYCAKDSTCLTSHCGACIGSVVAVEAAGSCLAERCAAVCPVASDEDGGV